MFRWSVHYLVAVNHWWDLVVGFSRVNALNVAGWSKYTLRGDEMGVEQARQPPHSFLKSVGCGRLLVGSRRWP